jgi:hypothetical protein
VKTVWFDCVQVALYKTGGGSKPPSQLTAVGEQMFARLHDHFVPIAHTLDSDADHHVTVSCELDIFVVVYLVKLEDSLT